MSPLLKTIRKVKGIETEFSILPNATLNDSLSWNAKGLLAYLCSKPEDWTVSVKQLCNHSKLSCRPTGRDATYSIIKELIAKGYMIRIQGRGDGKFNNTEYLVSSTPLTDFQEAVQDSPLTDLPYTVNPTLQSKDSNKVKIDKDLLSEPPVKTKKYKFTEDDLKLAEWMYERVLIINPTAAKPNFENWANTIRLMQEINEKTRHEICELFNWANRDHFWSTNIMSPDKLRKQWDALTVRRSAGSNYQSNQRDVNKISTNFEQPEGWKKGNFSGEGGESD